MFSKIFIACLFIVAAMAQPEIPGPGKVGEAPGPSGSTPSGEYRPPQYSPMMYYPPPIMPYPYYVPHQSASPAAAPSQDRGESKSPS